MNIEIEIIEKVVNNGASDSEKKLFEQWLAEDECHLEFYQRVVNYYRNDIECECQEITSEEIHGRWKEYAKKVKSKGVRRIIPLYAKGLSAAVAVVILTLFVVLPASNKKATNNITLEKREVKPLLIHKIPITTGLVTLITQSGEEYEIGDEKAGNKIISSTNFNADSETILYNKTKPEEIEYHTLTVPKGKDFKITLSDGTLVHLNANSRLIYPSSFSKDKERRVKLLGEAFFEVAHDKDLQFVVETENMDVRVYGTKFNVNTNKRNVTETVLVEGSVTVQCETSLECELMPNQIARHYNDVDKFEIKDVDVLNYISWRTGTYSFHEETLENIMTSISLWYDVDILFTDERIAQMKFICNLPQYSSIEQIMDILLLSGNIKYEIAGNKIIIFN